MWLRCRREFFWAGDGGLAGCVFAVSSGSMRRLWWLVAGFSAVVAVACAQQIKFVDVSKQAGLKGVDYLQNWRPEQNRYWGSCVFDADGDGYYDLLLPNHQQNTEFYWGGPDGFKFANTRTTATDKHGLGAVDWDGDGDEDFIISFGGRNGVAPILPRVYRTNGREQKFAQIDNDEIGIDDAVRGRSLAFFDMDADGDRDLLMVNALREGETKAHLIYENLGNGKFKKRTNIGLEESPGHWFCLVDIDRDQFLDVILMAHNSIEIWMGKGNLKYEKENWRLPNSDPASSLNAARACAEVDIDGDGRPEIYIPRGNKGEAADDVLFKVQSGRLKNISEEWNVPKGGKHSHVTYLDIDNDGKLDLYVSVMTWYLEDRIPDILLYNTGTKFKQINLNKTGLHVPYVPKEDGDTAVAFDYNKDGKVDLLVGSRYAPWRLYENRTPQNGNSWIRVSVGRPRMGVFQKSWYKDPWGALVIVVCKSPKTKLVQRTGTPGMSHSASNMLRLTFGVGKCEKVTLVKVLYIGGVEAKRSGRIKLNEELEVGLVNCPGRNCNDNIKPCTNACEDKPCERYRYNGAEKFCAI